MKQAIEWHAQCLKKHRYSVQSMRETVRREIEGLERAEKRLEEHEAQYAEAIRRGVKEYDADKFNKKRNKS